MGKLNELTLTQALSGIKTKKFTSVELTQDCLSAITSYNPKLNVYLTVTKDLALAQAAEADEKIARQGLEAFNHQPLLGIPYACKDNFCTKGIKTTASSNVLANFIPPYESTVTKRLKNAGAILLGKTNLDAFAHGSSTETSDFGTTLNPWDITRVPGGSSGGSAAAVAAHMCIFAIGSETAGSIRCPASWCGVTGVKPSYGRASRYGLIAMASSTDSPGPLTKTVEDAAYILQILAGKDPLDATTLTQQPENYLENLALLSNQAQSATLLKGLRIGRPKSYFTSDMEQGTLDAVTSALEVYSKLGAEIIDIDLLDPKYSIAVYTILQRSEVSSNLARIDGIRFGNDRSAFGFEARKRMLLGAYTLSAGYYDDYYLKAQKVRTLISEDFNRAFSQVDIIAGPAMPCVALQVGESAKSSMFGELIDRLNEPSSIAGICGLSIPCGFYTKLPVGLQLIGPVLKESLIMNVAYLYQQKTTFHLQYPKLEEEVALKP